MRRDWLTDATQYSTLLSVKSGSSRKIAGSSVKGLGLRMALRRARR